MTNQTSTKNPNLQYSTSNYAYMVGELATRSQIVGFLGFYAVSVLKNFDNLNPLAAATGITVRNVTHIALYATCNKIGVPQQLLCMANMLSNGLGLIAGAFTYISLSTLTIKVQLAINAIMLTAGLSAKYLNDVYPSQQQQQKIEEPYKKASIWRAAIREMAATDLTNILFCYALSVIKISDNFSPLAGGASLTIYSSIRDIFFRTYIKIGLSLDIAASLSTYFSIVASVSAYSFIAALTIKGQLAVNAALIITGFAAKFFDHYQRISS